MPASIGVNLRVTGHCRQGGRKYMEDYFSVAYQQTEDEKDLEYAFFGIYDGHGGAEAAAYAKEHLMENIVSQRSFWSNSDDEVLRAVRDGFLATHLAMWKDHENWPKTSTGLNSTAGTTASVAFIRRGKIYIGHVGDSGIVLGYQEPGCEDWKAKPLTKDHKPENENEILRIQQCGGKVVAKSGVPRVVWNRPRIGHKGPVRRSTPIDEIPFLAVARSLGDLWSYNSQLDEFVVSPDPDCHVHVIDTNTFRCLVLGTDGLYNMVTPQMAVHVVQQVERHNELSALSDSPHKVWLNPSKCLVEKSLERWNSTKMRADNTSVVTLMLDPPGPPRVQVLRSRKRKYTDSGLEISMRYDEQENERPQQEQRQTSVDRETSDLSEMGDSTGGEEPKRNEDGKLHSILYNQFTSKGEFLKTEDAKKVCSNTHDRKPIDASVMEEIYRRRYIEMRKSSNCNLRNIIMEQQQQSASSSNNYFAKYRPQSVNNDEIESEDPTLNTSDALTGSNEKSPKDIQINEISSSDIDDTFPKASIASNASSLANSVVQNEPQPRKSSSRRLDKLGPPLAVVSNKSFRNKRVNGEVTTTLLPDLSEATLRRRRGRSSLKEENGDKLATSDSTTLQHIHTSSNTAPVYAPLHPVPDQIAPISASLNQNTRVLRERRNTPDPPESLTSNNPNQINAGASPNMNKQICATSTNPSMAGNTGNSNNIAISDAVRPCTSSGIRRRLNVVQNLLFGQQLDGKQGDKVSVKRGGSGGGESMWKEEEQDLSKGQVTPSKTELLDDDLIKKASSNINNRASKSTANFSNRLRNRNQSPLIDININLDKENNSATNPQQETYRISTRRSTTKANSTVVASSNTNARLATLRSEVTRTRSAANAVLSKVTKIYKKSGLKTKLKPKQGKLKMVGKMRDRLREDGLRLTGRGSSAKRGGKGRQ